MKRDIARIYTVIRERELGIRATPAPLEPKAAAKRSSKKDDTKTEVVDDAPVAEATVDAPAAADTEAAPAKASSSKAKAKEAK